jgi:hypothetical protein
MPEYNAPVWVTIDADNQRDAFDSLDAFLDAISAQAEPFGVSFVRPTFDDVRHASN